MLYKKRASPAPKNAMAQSSGRAFDYPFVRRKVTDLQGGDAAPASFTQQQGAIKRRNRRGVRVIELKPAAEGGVRDDRDPGGQIGGDVNAIRAPGDAAEIKLELPAGTLRLAEHGGALLNGWATKLTVWPFEPVIVVI